MNRKTIKNIKSIATAVSLSYLSFLTIISNSKAYEIASNHSYVKNSEFTTDHTITINGYGDLD